MTEEEKLKLQIEHLKCVMLAAANEISEFWHVHSSEGGLGPVTLMNYLRGTFQVTHASNPYPQYIGDVRSSDSSKEFSDNVK
jgi:hypothetical protein